MLPPKHPQSGWLRQQTPLSDSFEPDVSTPKWLGSGKGLPDELCPQSGEKLLRGSCPCEGINDIGGGILQEGRAWVKDTGNLLNPRWRLEMEVLASTQHGQRESPWCVWTSSRRVTRGCYDDVTQSH